MISQRYIQWLIDRKPYMAFVIVGIIIVMVLVITTIFTTVTLSIILWVVCSPIILWLIFRPYYLYCKVDTWEEDVKAMRGINSDEE